MFGAVVTVRSNRFFIVWVYSAGTIIEKWEETGSHKLKLTNTDILH
jgi:hypothetical protein